MFSALILITLITLIVWRISQVVGIKICPACVGVSSAWLILTAGVLTEMLSSNSWQMIIAILMGGSVVGIAFQGEKSIKWAEKNPMWWKLIVVLPGFLAVYGAIKYMSWGTLAGAIVVLGAVMYVFFVRKGKVSPQQVHRNDDPSVKKLEKDLEKCC